MAEASREGKYCRMCKEGGRRRLKGVQAVAKASLYSIYWIHTCRYHPTRRGKKGARLHPFHRQREREQKIEGVREKGCASLILIAP